MYRFAVITEEGRKLLADTTANNNLKITKILCGDGLPDGIEDCLTETKLKELMIKQKGLVSGQGRFGIESYSVSGDTWTIKALATKESASKAFKALEAGIYACRTNDSTEVMIAYFLAGDYLQGKLNDTADYIFIPTGGKATITLPVKLGSGINPEFVLAEDLYFSIEEGEDTNYLTPRKYRILTVKDEFGTYQTKIMDGMDGMPVGATYKQYPSVYKKVSITKDKFDANPGKYYQAGTGDAQNNDPFDVATAFVSGRQYFECIFKSYRPQQIYGGEWRDCTEAFAGYFERAEGGNSGAFGTNADGTPISQDSQNKSHKHTTTKHTHSFTPSGTVSAHSHGLNSHTHSFTPSGSIVAGGEHYHYVEYIDNPPSVSTTKSKTRVNAYYTAYVKEPVTYNALDGAEFAGGDIIYYPSIWRTDKGIGVCFDGAFKEMTTAKEEYLTNGYQSPTSWSGWHSHNFTGSAGITGAASGNTASATPTFTGKEGNTAGGGGLDTGNEGGDEARPVNIAYRMWQRVA